MKTGNLKYLKGVYKREKQNDLKTTFDYKLIQEINPNGIELLNEVIRVEKDNGYHDRSRDFDFWLYFRNETNWKRCIKSGLAKTEFANIFEGNISKVISLKTKTRKGKDFENPQHFILCQSIDNWNKIVIDIFPDFYPAKMDLQRVLIKEHYYNQMQ